MTTIQRLTCGTLIDCTGAAPVRQCTIVVEDDKIHSVTPGVDNTIPGTIDLTRCTVMPGFVDCHDHLGIDMGDEVAQSKEPLSYIAVKGVKNARDILAAGVTTVRDVGEPGHLDVAWRRAIREGMIPGPDLLISGQFVTRTGGHAWFFGNEVDGVDAVRMSVREQLKVQVDWIKMMVSGGSSTPGSVVNVAEYSEEEISACIDEAHRGGRKVSAHIHGGPGATWAIKHGIDSIEHGTYLQDDDLRSMAKKGIWLVSTAGLLTAIVRTPNMPPDYAAKAARSVKAISDLQVRARAFGVKVAYGGDTYHGHPSAELAMLRQAGYSPMEALQVITRNGAQLCDLDDVVGTIEPGKRANIIAVQGDPLADTEAVEQVRFVMKGGEIFRNR